MNIYSQANLYKKHTVLRCENFVPFWKFSIELSPENQYTNQR